MHDLMEVLQQTKTELSGFIARGQSELGRATKDVKNLTARLDQMEVARAMAGSGQPGGGRPDLVKRIWDDGDFGALRIKGRGKAILAFPDLGVREVKTAITSAAVGSATSGVLVPQRVPGVVPEARRQLYLRDLLTIYPCGNNAVDYVKVNTGISDASPQVEASDKYENALTFTTVSALVRTIATWIPATRQVLEDFSALRSAIEGALMYAVLKEEEDQLLSGDNTGQNLNGLITQAQAFDTGLLIAADGWEKVDIIARACQQLAADSEIAPDFVALHPNDFWGIRLTKDNQGRYIFGDPAGPAPANLFGLRVVESSGITPATFLVGNSSPAAAAIYERLGLVVEISTEHSDYFTKNMVAIRAEERIALVVFRPNAFVTGSLNTSPA